MLQVLIQWQMYTTVTHWKALRPICHPHCCRCIGVPSTAHKVSIQRYTESSFHSNTHTMRIFIPSWPALIWCSYFPRNWKKVCWNLQMKYCCVFLLNSHHSIVKHCFIQPTYHHKFACSCKYLVSPSRWNEICLNPALSRVPPSEVSASLLQNLKRIPEH